MVPLDGDNAGVVPVTVYTVSVYPVSILLVSVWESVVPTTSPVGAVLEVFQLEPVDTANPALG